MVRALPGKQCSSDPLPTWWENVGLLAPFLSRLICWSLEHGVVPSGMKSAYITPILKKADMDPADTKSYRPISNLSVLQSKLLERLVSKQLVTYLRDNGLLPDRQSAYRAHHSTETAQGSIRYFAGSGFRQLGSSDVVGLVGCLRQCRPSDATPTVADILVLAGR